MILNFLLMALTIADPGCELKIINSDQAILTEGNRSETISIISRKAKIVSCERAKEDKKLLVAYIQLGEGGTQKISEPVHLLIFRNRSARGLRKVFEYYAGEASQPKKWVKFELKSDETAPKIVLVSSRKEYSLR